jgi:hypothetical protein
MKIGNEILQSGKQFRHKKGWPDFSWCNIPKCENLYPMITKINQIAIKHKVALKHQMALKQKKCPYNKPKFYIST